MKIIISNLRDFWLGCTAPSPTKNILLQTKNQLSCSNNHMQTYGRGRITWIWMLLTSACGISIKSPSAVPISNRCEVKCNWVIAVRLWGSCQRWNWQCKNKNQGRQEKICKLILINLGSYLGIVKVKFCRDSRSDSGATAAEEWLSM